MVALADALDSRTPEEVLAEIRQRIAKEAGALLVTPMATEVGHSARPRDGALFVAIQPVTVLRWLRETILPTPDDPDWTRKCYTCPKRRYFERWCDRHTGAPKWHPDAGPCLRADWLAPEPATPPYALDLAACLERVCAGTGTAADAQRLGYWLPQGVHAAHLQRLNDKPHGEGLLREMLALEELLRQAGVAMDFSESRRFEITPEPPTDLPAIPQSLTSTCYTCGGSSFWASCWVERICCVCHPQLGTPERCEAFEERAAILEHDAKFPNQRPNASQRRGPMHNYARKMAKYRSADGGRDSQAPNAEGSTIYYHIWHDEWCDHNRGGRCNCDPDINLEMIPREAHQ